MALSIAKIAAILTLFAAVDIQPLIYYTVVRCVVTAVCLWSAYAAKKRGNGAWCGILVVLAVLYNPLHRFHPGRELWQAIDVIAASVLCLSFYLHRPPRAAPVTGPSVP